MSAPMTHFLQSKTPTADTDTSYDAPAHPEKNLLAYYLVRVTGTIAASVAATPTWAEFKSEVLGKLFKTFKIDAPRYSNQLCGGSLDGSYWAELFEEYWKIAMPVEIDNKSLDHRDQRQIGTDAKDFQFDFIITPFENPLLGADAMYFAPPAHLFRGDVTLKTNHTTSTGSISLGGTTTVITVAGVKFTWHAVTKLGDSARVPPVHKFEKRTIGADSLEVGRGFMPMVKDVRAPSDSIAYDIIIDGKNVNNGQIAGETLMAVYQISRMSQIPEASVYTPLRYIPSFATPNDLEFVTRSFSLKLYGATSATLLLHIIEPSTPAIQANVKAALGIAPNAETVIPPLAPNNAALGGVHEKVALNGPRTLFVREAGGLAAPASSPKTITTVPPGLAGAQLARGA